MSLNRIVEDMASNPPKTKRIRTHAKRFCEHCKCFVSKTTWYNHRDISSHGGEESISDLRDIE